jgi:hypothetical protein
MGDVLSRLLPSVRDVRTPLALGYSLILLVWGAVTVASNGNPGGSAVGALYIDLSNNVPGLVEFGAVTFVATLVSSGLVRLIDRFMRMTPTRRRDRHNPFDDPAALASVLGRSRVGRWSLPIFRLLRRKRHPRWVDDDGPADSVGEFVQVKRISWGAGDAYERERHQFLFHLGHDEDFGALQAEQLMRAVMMVPATIGALLTVWWFGFEREWSVASLMFSFVGLLAILVADYGRIGQLMYNRWTSLAREYPDWLPIDYQAHRRSNEQTSPVSAHPKIDQPETPKRDPPEPT